MDITSLNSSARKYRKELLMVPVIGLEKSSKHMTVIPGITDSLSVSELTGDVELRPHDGNVNNQSPFALKSRILQVRLGDVITQQKPETLRQTIWGEKLTGSAKDLSKHPIEKQIIAKIMSSVGKKLNAKLFSAVRNASGTTTADLFNGFDTITATEISGGDLAVGNSNYEVVGEITVSNACDKLHDFYKAASDELQESNSKMFVSSDIYNKYNECWKDENGSLPYNTEYKKTFLQISGDKCELVPLVGKSSSDYIHLTKKENMLIGVDQMSDKEFVKVREIDNPFKAQFVLTMLFGVQFNTLSKELLYVGNVASGS